MFMVPFGSRPLLTPMANIFWLSHKTIRVFPLLYEEGSEMRRDSFFDFSYSCTSWTERSTRENASVIIADFIQSLGTFSQCFCAVMCPSICNLLCPDARPPKDLFLQTKLFE